jgi:hypothetical protein
MIFDYCKKCEMNTIYCQMNKLRIAFINLRNTIKNELIKERGKIEKLARGENVSSSKYLQGKHWPARHF